MEVELIIGPQEQALDGTNLSLSIGGDLQVDFLKPNNSMLRFDDLSIEVFLAHDSEEYIDSKILQFPCKLYLIISEAAVLALEGADHDFSEEGDLGEHDVGGAVLFAVGAEALDGVGWMEEKVPYSRFFMSENSDCMSFFCMRLFNFKGYYKGEDQQLYTIGNHRKKE